MRIFVRATESDLYIRIKNQKNGDMREDRAPHDTPVSIDGIIHSYIENGRKYAILRIWKKRGEDDWTEHTEGYTAFPEDDTVPVDN
jgi:hypothetical protein